MVLNFNQEMKKCLASVNSQPTCSWRSWPGSSFSTLSCDVMKLKNLFPIIPAVIVSGCAAAVPFLPYVPYFYGVYAEARPVNASVSMEQGCLAWGEIAYSSARMRDSGTSKIDATAINRLMIDQFSSTAVSKKTSTRMAMLSIDTVYSPVFKGVSAADIQTATYIACKDGTWRDLMNYVNDYR